MDRDYVEKLFAYGHLPPQLQDHSRPFHELAAWIMDTVPANAERVIALRLLLQAKDAAVRARVIGEQPK